MSAPVMVTLRDGSQTLWLDLETLMAKIQAIHSLNFFTFYHFVEKCRDPLYQIRSTPFSNSRKVLQEYKLIDTNGRIEAIVRRVVLNAVQGKDFDMHLIDPTKKV